ISLDSSGLPGLFIDGGRGTDTLTLDFSGTQVTQDEGDDILSYLANHAGRGTLTINGVVVDWVNFERLIHQNLIFIARLEVSNEGLNADVSLTVTFTDSRLNATDIAAPVAVYCADGGFTVWQIDPNTGSGTQVVATTLAELTAGPVSGGSATMALADSGMV